MRRTWMRASSSAAMKACPSVPSRRSRGSSSSAQLIASSSYAALATVKYAGEPTGIRLSN